jgi:hypothetical protein
MATTLPDFTRFHQRRFPKAKIWRAAERFVFGTYFPDDVIRWHFADESHWMEADTFDHLVEAVRERGWFNAA